MSQHPQFNKTGTWKGSKSQKLLIALNLTPPCLVLPASKQLSTDKKFLISWENPDPRAKNAYRTREDQTTTHRLDDSAEERRNPKRGKSLYTVAKCMICNDCQIKPPFLQPCHFTSMHDDARVNSEVLVDGGAQGSYIKEDIAAWLVANGHAAYKYPRKVCGCFGDCRISENAFTVYINFFDSVTNETYKFLLTFGILPSLNVPVVIGRNDTDKYNLEIKIRINVGISKYKWYRQYTIHR
jgi:hypothetical protein